MAYKTPQEIASQYLAQVKSLKPEVNTDQTDSDWYVRSRAVGGVMAGVYADQAKIANDALPQSARREALARHLELWFGSGFKGAQPSVGTVFFSGTTGSSITTGQQFQYDPNGNLYQATADVTLDDGAVTGTVPVQSVNTGQNQNLLEGASLTVSSPPAGIDPTATVYGGPLSDGRDEESNDQATTRILLELRARQAGGRVSDYQQFALEASPAVTYASILRYPFGLGTVGVVIQSGTQDIDAALNAGDPIVLTPSDALIDTVQAYINDQAVVTDCVTVMPAASAPVDATINVRFFSGNSATLLDDPLNPGFQLTQAEFVQREAQRAIWKTPAGGRIIGASGFVVASEIEQQIDANLSAQVGMIGNIVQIIADRQCEDLSATGANLSLLGNQYGAPRNINIVEM